MVNNKTIRTDLIKFSISIAVVVTVAVFAIGSIVASVNAQPSNFTITPGNMTAGAAVLNCADGRSLTFANIQAGQTCSSTPLSSPPTAAPVVNSTPAPVVNSTPSPTPANNSSLASLPVSPIFSSIKPAMVVYKDPQNRFSLLKPNIWIALPQTDQYQPQLVKMQDFNGTGLEISILPGTETNPQVMSQALAARIGFQYAIFKPVTCNLKVSGNEACSFIVTNPGDTNLGTGGRVLQSIVSYINGQMVSINMFANEDIFDKVKPTFDAMIHSLHFGGNSISVGPTGTGIATGSSGSANLLH